MFLCAPVVFLADDEDDDEEEEEDNDAISLRTDDIDDDMEMEARPNPPAVVSRSDPSVHASSSQASVAFVGSYAGPPGWIPPPVPKIPWNPIHVKFQFIDGQMKTHQAIVLLCPSGVGLQPEAEDIKLSLEGGALQWLKVVVKWPAWFVNQGFLALMRTAMTDVFEQQIPSGMGEGQRSQLKRSFQQYLFGFEMALMQTMMRMRSEASSPVLESETLIQLDMSVKKLTMDDWHIIGDLQGTRLLIVDLKASEETDYEEEKTKSVALEKTDKSTKE